MSDLTTQKSWFSKPEGKVGTVIPLLALAAGGAGLLYTWGAVLPWLIGVASNTLHLALLAGGIGVLGMVVADARWRSLAFYGYKSAMRALTGVFIEIDPIGILRTYINTLRDRLEEMDKALASLKGQLTSIKGQIDENTREREHSMDLARQAQKIGNRQLVTLHGNHAVALEESNARLGDLFNRMTKLSQVLAKLREVSQNMTVEIQMTVDLKTKERAALQAGYKAFSKARKIMEGSDDRELFNMTMDKLAEDYGSKMGEIESFMDMSKDVISSVDLEGSLNEDKILAKLAALDEKGQSFISPVVPVTSDTGGREFSDLFSRNSTRS